ncbi:Na+/H+ antiporter [Terrihabitans sp. B22-R8]|uniref:Na+/H+ antiporter n=1 Tax=Terrihabitans sp. B22-R8 TaxID=3425128 RepID=UPI00403C5310
MDVISVALILMLAVVVSGAMGRMLPSSIPLPLIQIALGAFISGIADLGVKLHPEIFFLLFLPPLLFLDGWRIPKEGLSRDKGFILELALGLVILTVVGVGFFLHWLIPSMPLAVCFAVAAVVSPTDPIAVSAVASQTPVPNRLMHILEGESLLNDASGLVCLRFAIAAALTGTFSLADASLTFLWLAAGGISIGVGVTWLIASVRRWLNERYGEEPAGSILLTVLMPFGAYILAEEVHCSGILAAVAAGISMSYFSTWHEMRATTRVNGNAVWDMIQFAANGIIFVLLGEQLPDILSGAMESAGEAGTLNPWWLLVYVLAINAALIGVRLAWVWTSVHFFLFRETRRGNDVKKPSRRLVLAMSVAGVRGAITLAGVLTLPITLVDGSPFPARDLAIFLAAGVIIFSIVIASVTLPRLLKNVEFPLEPSEEEAEDMARIAAAEAAIQAIEQTQHELAEGRSDADIFADVGSRLMDVYRARVASRRQASEIAASNHMLEGIERQLRLAALTAERRQILRLRRRREIGEEIARKLIREVDYVEARFS